MKQNQIYKCPTCKSTKEIRIKPGQSVGVFNQQLPEKIVCGWRGCMDYAVKI